MNMTERLIIGPFNRVEGDLEVQLDVVGGRVATAYVNSPLYRGFEQILAGKQPLDALVLVPRICGICSVSQSAAAAAALREAMGVQAPPNGVLAANLVLAAENLADHFTHFYLFFMPDFAREAYAGRSWSGPVKSRFEAVKGSAAADALPARAAFLNLLGILAGKWPHTLSLQPGGSARPVDGAERLRLISLLRDFRRWLERYTFGDTLEAFAALESLEGLSRWADAQHGQTSDLRHFLRISDELGLAHIGRAGGRFLSYGAYRDGSGQHLFSPGVYCEQAGKVVELDAAAITEDVSHAWMRGETRHPFEGLSLPDADKAEGYTWCKAPRLDGNVMECGALARQLVDGHPLVRDIITRQGASVVARVVCRMLELARVLPVMEAWARAIEPGAPFCVPGKLPDDFVSSGLVEAARGALGHWLVVRQGRIASYQIIAPTTWNFSPRDAAGQPGALEMALQGLRVEDPRVPLQVQHVVRSFDPCMVCTVH